ncbi:hypothetical protein [Alistipes sp. ZOR0009]|uniref:DUF7660 family protein n=1 Tax=Alistipes sp. ZOR0009 TaxID=1339253 RepID=UPI00064657C9|nr:hypothetical protein [Alistipes sp. ZOR0009]
MEVTDKNTFIDFLEKFREDLKQNPENWENKDLNDFLEAMSRYTEDIQGYYDNTNQDIDSEKPSWKLFADILKGASLYE